MGGRAISTFEFVFILTLSALIVLAFLAPSLWVKWKNRHQHTWKTYKVKCGKATGGGTIPEGSWATQVYRRCTGCNRLYTYTKEGHFTLGELTGEAFKDDK